MIVRYMLMIGYLMLSYNIEAMEAGSPVKKAKRSFEELSLQESDESSSDGSVNDESSNMELDDKNTSGELVAAVLSNSVGKVRELLLAGAKCTIRGPGNKTLLMLALERKYKEIAEILLAHPGFIIDSHDSNNDRHISTLGYVIEQDYDDIVDKILERFGITKNSCTPILAGPSWQMLANGLVNAVKFDKPYFVHKFLTLGAILSSYPLYLTQVISTEDTVLAFAIKSGKSQAVIRLLIAACIKQSGISFLLEAGYKNFILDVLNCPDDEQEIFLRVLSDPSFVLQQKDIAYLIKSNYCLALDIFMENLQKRDNNREILKQFAIIAIQYDNIAFANKILAVLASKPI
jgi:hypothetical protein